ncbi:hypothetical protein BY458DRAFT_504454 [Sporodiniella umbellata]|nr:hypothetical protein BY458DRAFT_504454 [Sporodiniella umbellata]
MIYASNITSTSLPLPSTVKDKRSSFMTYTQRKAREDRILLDSYIYYRQRKHKNYAYIKSSLAREERIRLYQYRFTQTIETSSGLKAWIQSNKDKGPILPPPKVQYPYIQKRETGFTSPKISISTFLKKAIRTSESAHKQSKKAQKKNRFSLTGSLHRFTKNTGSHLEVQPDVDIKRKEVHNVPVAAQAPHMVVVDRPKKRHPSIFLEKLEKNPKNSQIITFDSKDTLYDSCRLKQPSKSMTSSFRQSFQGFVKDTDRLCNKSSTVGRKGVCKENRYSLTDKCKPTWNSSDTLERKNKMSFSFATSLSAIRFMPQKPNFHKRQELKTPV